MCCFSLPELETEVFLGLGQSLYSGARNGLQRGAGQWPYRFLVSPCLYPESHNTSTTEESAGARDETAVLFYLFGYLGSAEKLMPIFVLMVDTIISGYNQVKVHKKSCTKLLWPKPSWTSLVGLEMKSYKQTCYQLLKNTNYKKAYMFFIHTYPNGMTLIQVLSGVENKQKNY